MAHERTGAPWHQPSFIPAGYDWPALLAAEGDALEAQYRRTLDALGREPGMLGLIFRKAQNRIQDPAKLRRLVADLIDREQWTTLDADVKGDAYEGLLEKNAQDTKGGAGQYFTPRALIAAVVDCIAPAPGETVCDPACGTGGFLLAAHDGVVRAYPHLDRSQRRHLKLDALRGVELVDGVARLCAMNLMLHGIGPTAGEEADPPVRVDDALRADPGERFDVVLTNPPFGKKSSVRLVNEEGEEERQALTVVREDFWATTSNKQLAFLQHVHTLLTVHGRAAVVVPDNVLFEGGAGETVRRTLLHDCDVHTLLRLPTGDLLRAGRQGQRALLRPPAGERRAADAPALGVRSPHQPALHAQDAPARARGPRRFRRLLPTGRPGGARPDLERRVQPGWAVARVRIRRTGGARQGVARRLLAAGRGAGDLGQPARPRSDRGGDRRGPCAPRSPSSSSWRRRWAGSLPRSGRVAIVRRTGSCTSPASGATLSSRSAAWRSARRPSPISGSMAIGAGCWSTPRGRCCTQREHAGLALGRVRIDAPGATRLTLVAPGQPPLWVTAPHGDAPRGDAPRVRVTVFDDTVDAALAAPAAHAWATAWLGAPTRLVYLPDDARRPVDPRYAAPGDRTAFSDGYPVLVASQASLDDLNRRLATAGAAPVDVARFRPNVLVAPNPGETLAPFAEDAWQALRLGARVALALVKPCARCVVTTINQATATRGVEPLRTLAGYRRRAGKVLFAQNAVVRATGVVRVGEPAAVDVTLRHGPKF